MALRERSHDAPAGSCFIRWEKTSLDNETVGDVTFITMHMPIRGRQSNGPPNTSSPQHLQCAGLHGRTE